MRRLISRHLLLAALVPLVGPAGWLGAAWSQGVEPRVETLDNGLKLILVERHEEPIVAGCMIFDVGSVNDPRGRSGIAHLFEHMLFKGSRVIGTTDYEAERPIIEQQDKLREKMNAEMNRMRLMKRRGKIDDVLDPKQWTPEYVALKKQYDELLETERAYMTPEELNNLYVTNGGRGLNAGTSNDMTIYYVQLPANKLELFFWLESDRMANGVMREFYVERENVREERRMRTESTPVGRFNEAFNALFWQVHPYGIPVLGWASEVESITRDDVREFYKIYYAPNNARMVLVGDFDGNRVVELANRYFGRVPRCPNPPEPLITEEPRPIAERRFCAEAETNPEVRICYHTVAIGHPDEAALDVLSQLLSGRTGRLYKRLVTQEDAAIGQPGGYNESRKYAGSFEVNVTVKEGHEPEDVEQIVLEEVAKLREGEITDYELQKVKNQVLAQSVRGLQNNVGLMFQLAVYDTWYDWNYINEAPARMLQVTADDVRRVVAEYLDPKTRTVAIYRTKGGAAPAGDDELTAALADVPPEVHGQIRAMIKQIETTDDVDMLQQRSQGMEQMADRVPPDQKAVFDYTLKVMKARLAELEAAEGTSDTTEPTVPEESAESIEEETN